MQEETKTWHTWAAFLHRSGMANIFAVLLVNLGYLRILIAQVFYICQPLVVPFIDEEKLSMLIRLFEDDNEAHRFARILTEEQIS